MDGIIPVAAQIQPPDPQKGLGLLSSIIGVQQQRQNLQTGQYQQATAQAESQQAQQKNRELQAAQQLTINGAKSGQYDDGEGGIDRQKLSNDLLKVAPTYGQPIMSSLLSQANEIVQNKRAHQALSQEQQGQMGSTFGSLATKQDLTPSDFVDALNTLTDQNKDPQFKRMAMSMLTHLPPNASPQQLQQLARRWSIAATDVGSAAAQSNPAVSTMQAPGGLQPINTNPQAPGGTAPVGQPMPQGIAPGVVTSPMTGGLGVTTPSGGVRPLGGNAPGFNPTYAGQKNDIEAYRGEVQNIRAEAQQAPLARNINQQILRLTQDAKTGPGSDTWQHVIGAVGAPFGLSPTASYQEVGKFLEKNAIASMQAMGGPPSDSRLDAAAKANGSTSFSPEALRTVTKFNDATTTALDQYRQGIDHTVGTGQSVDYSKLPAYKAAWAKNFDVNVFRVENAIRDGDAAELNKIKSELGPKGLKALAEKRKNLQSLMQGQIPP
jgi:hypothetical protein